MPTYMCLLYNDPAWYKTLSPEEMQKATEKYMNWRNNAWVTDGKRLASEPGQVIRAENGKARAVDGPYSETKEVFAGYYTIEAANYDEAVERAKTLPHLDYGGTIEVRHVYGT
jgi:hypothetical protein